MTQNVAGLHSSLMLGIPAALRIAACALLWLPLPAQALTIVFGGVVDGLVDGAGRLDGSVSIGTPVAGRYEVDPTPSGGAFGEVGPARLLFGFGSYDFDRTQDPHTIALIDDSGPPIAPVDIWQAGEFVLASLAPALSVPADHVGYGAGLQLFDFTATNLDGTEPAPFVPTDLADWSSGRLFLNALVDDLAGGTAIGDLQITVDLQSWSVVPEPSSAALVGLGLFALGFRRRRS